MHTPIRTEMGTVLVNGIEYNECPLPGQLVKLMKRKWADQLLKKGAVRFHDLEYYRQWENKYLGDPNDGIAVLNVNNLSLETRSGNDVYAWCLSLPEIKHERMLLLAQHGGYDCKVVISNPKEFITRVNNWLSEHKKGSQLHCGLVTYNRCVNVTKATANAQKFNFNVFQKSAKFQDDQEYRLAITEAPVSESHGEYLDLEIENCDDIVSLHTFPNSR